MDRDTVGLLVMVTLLLATVATGGFVAGRQYQNRYWKDTITDQMNKLCNECYDVGRNNNG